METTPRAIRYGCDHIAECGYCWDEQTMFSAVPAACPVCKAKWRAWTGADVARRREIERQRRDQGRETKEKR